MYKQTFSLLQDVSDIFVIVEFLKIRRADIDNCQKFNQTSFSNIFPQISRRRAVN